MNNIDAVTGVERGLMQESLLNWAGGRFYIFRLVKLAHQEKDLDLSCHKLKRAGDLMAVDKMMAILLG